MSLRPKKGWAVSILGVYTHYNESHFYLDCLIILCQAAKLGCFITGPRASASLKPTGPWLVLLVQIIYTYMKILRLPNIFYHRANNRK